MRTQKTQNPTVSEAVDVFYQKRFLRILLLILIGVTALQAVFLTATGSFLNAGFNLLVLVGFWVAVFLLHRHYYQLASSLTILTVLSLLVFSVLVDGLSNATIFWFFAFPVVATFLKGKDGGSIWLLSVVLIILAIFFATQLGYVQVDVISYEADTFLQMILAILLVAVFVYFYQDNLDQKTRSVQEREKKLSAIYGQLQDEIKRRKEIADALDEKLHILSRQNARDEALLQSIGEGVIAVDRDEAVILANSVTLRLFNYYEEDIMQKQYRDVMTLCDENGEAVLMDEHPLMQTLRLREHQHTSQYYYRNYNQELIPVAITTSPVTIGEEVVGAIEVFRDVSDERAIARAKDEFLSLASHQLRTPLGAVRWYAERLLKKTRLSVKNRTYLQAIYEDSARMSGLLADYLNASRLQLRTNKLYPKQQAVSEVIDKVVSDLEPIVQDKELEIVRHEDRDKQLLTDSQLLEMIVQNLVSNAVKYTPPKGAVTISIRPYSGHDKHFANGVVLSVEDTGIGIPKAEQHNVFSKLFRAENALTSEIEGTGLGLYGVSQAVDRLGGKIWFESSPSKGTHFAVTLPQLDAGTIKKKEAESE